MGLGSCLVGAMDDSLLQVRFWDVDDGAAWEVRESLQEESYA